MGRSGGPSGGRSGGRSGGSFSGGGRSGGGFFGNNKGRSLFSGGRSASGGRSNRGDDYSGRRRYVGGGSSFLPFLPFLINSSRRGAQQQVIPPPPNVTQTPTPTAQMPDGTAFSDGVSPNSSPVSTNTSPATPGTSQTTQSTSPTSPNNSNGPVPFKPQSGMTKTMRLIMIAAVVVLAVGFFGLLATGNSDTVENTIERTPLEPGAVTETGYYEDLAGDWIQQRASLENGLRYFYDKTGVQPFVIILPNGQTSSSKQLTEFAQEAYGELFSDEGHFLLVFCDQNDGTYVCAYALGTQARTVMDPQAIGVLEQNLEKNYLDYSLSEEQIFSNTFAETANQIMQVHSAPSGRIGYVIAILVAGVVICVIVIISNKKKKQALEEQQRKQILDAIDQPLEKFSDKEVEELASKYESADK